MNVDADLVIFDWDGTLANSIAQIVESLQFAARCYQQQLSAEVAKSVIGLGLPEVMQHLFPEVPHLQSAIMQCYSQHHQQHAVDNAWFDGVKEMLYALKAEGRLLAVATGKSRKALDRELDRTQSQHLFDITRTASETLSKPNPLMLIEILQNSGMHAKRAVMVGDSSYDLHMAQQIAMPRIGVSYGVHSVQQLQQFEPLQVVDSVSHLQNILLRQPT